MRSNRIAILYLFFSHVLNCVNLISIILMRLINAEICNIVWLKIVGEIDLIKKAEV